MQRVIRSLALGALTLAPIVGLSSPVDGAAKAKPAATRQIIIACSPNPVIETGISSVAIVCQVEANPSFANKLVTISSTQLQARCIGGFAFHSIILGPSAAGSPAAEPNASTATQVIDNDGNSTVAGDGNDCAPGSALVEASLDAPPFVTATTKLVMLPPQVTPRGVKVYPGNEVETGDGGFDQGTYGQSDVYNVFMVEAPPVYAEQLVTLTSDQLTARCGLGYAYFVPGAGPGNIVLAPTAPGSGPASANGPFGAAISGVVVETSIDNDGNATFVFTGASCAAGKSTVIADVQAGGPTYATQYAILPPAVTV